MSRVQIDVPFFSIIAAVYNVAPYLRKCVGSILAQGSKNYELILVDDGSTDGSADICDMFAEKYARVRVIHKKNGGLSSARNAGIRKALGTYVLFADGDDFIAADSLEKIQKSIQNSGLPDVVFLKGRKVFAERGTSVPMEDGISSAVCRMGQKEIHAYLAALPKFPASACTKAVRRSMFADGTLYFRENLLCEDLEWSPRLFLSMTSAGCCDSDYYCYRQGRQGSISNTSSEKKAMDVLSIIQSWNRCAKRTGDEQERQMICSLMEYAFRHLMLNYSSVSRVRRREYRRRVRQNAWILHTRTDAASRLIAYSYHLIGICLTGKLLKIYLWFRDGFSAGDGSRRNGTEVTAQSPASGLKAEERNDAWKDALMRAWRRED